MADCSRRAFFGQLGQTLAARVLNTIGTLRSELANRSAPAVAEPPPRRWLRPPGALPEAEFLTTCTRCTDCQTACPYQSIRRLGPEFAQQAGTPVIIPEESPCYLCADLPCITACAPRALLPLLRSEVSLGLAVIDSATCYLAQGQPCDYCLARCPLGKEAIRLDDRGLPQILESGCTGCGVCAYLCPAHAITITSAPTA